MCLVCSGSRRNRGGKRVEELVVVLAMHRDHRGPSLLSDEAWCGGGRRTRQAVVLVYVRKRRERQGVGSGTPMKPPILLHFFVLFNYDNS